ncbi:MAG: hypothetical protein ABI613_10070, partial [Gemmatimonadota bacterium]
KQRIAFEATQGHTDNNKTTVKQQNDKEPRHKTVNSAMECGEEGMKQQVPQITQITQITQIRNSGLPSRPLRVTQTTIKHCKTTK